MRTLIIQHVPDSDPAQFQVVRPEDGKRTDPVGAAPPQSHVIDGRPESDLIQELQWYLETFLEYPFSPETEHAERVQETLRTWGQQAFEAVFGSRQSSRLFESGSVAEAARAGRQEMFTHRDRVCARGQFPLDDWLVPVVYQQSPMDFTFATKAPRPEVQDTRLPDEALEAESPYGFIGRDAAILALERALRRPTSAVLIQGLGGIGKTTLARGFLHWLESTEGLGAGCIWLSFQDIHSADYVLNRMGESIFDSSFATESTEHKIEALAEVFKANRVLMAWDNFEVVRGIAGTEVHATLPEADQQILLRFLTRLRGGRTKVIITSRSQEEWLGIQRLPIRIGGLQGEERWQFCDAILRDLGLAVNREDADLVALMALLNGHPLAMRVVLPKLESATAASMVSALQSNLAALGLGEDDAQAKLYATLQLAEQSLPEELHPLLILLGLHKRFVQAKSVRNDRSRTKGL